MKTRCPLPTNSWGEIEPWPWLRFITPWWALHWLCNRYHLCWSGMVMWKMGYGWSWSLSRSCLFPFDYCGYYDDASDQEREEALRIIGESPEIVFNETK